MDKLSMMGNFNSKKRFLKENFCLQKGAHLGRPGIFEEDEMKKMF